MDSWNSFMQSKRARMVMYGACVFFTVYHALDAILEMLSPERSAAYIETLGTTNFYLMDVGRSVVCVITAIAFGRMLLKVMKEPDD